MLYTKKIFIADDDNFASTMYQRHLQNLGYDDVTCFINGTSCLESLILKPDIIFLDHQMDDLNGFEVLKKIKRYDPNIFIVMVSGQEDMTTALDSLKYGAFDYIIKGEATLDKIAKVLERMGEIDRLIRKNKKSPFHKLVNLFF